jgi:hypothetical protein
VSAPSRQGNTLKASCRFGPAVLDNQLPFFILGTVCNHVRGNNPDGSYLISPGCTLLRANWKFTAQFAAPISAAFPFLVNLSGLARSAGDAPVYFDNWFAGGVIEWGAGVSIQRRYITSSATPVGGAFSITLHRYFNSVPNIGDTLVLYPGCDGLASTCKAYDGATNPIGKFDNYDNFGAEPLMPVGNPSLVGQPSLGVQGGKK